MELLSLLSLTIFFVNLSLLSYIAASRSYTCVYARRLQYYDEKKLLQSEMQTFTNVTKIECSSACGREKFCLSFLFYYDVTKCVTLRGRFEHFTMTSNAVRGYELFQTDKPFATVGSDCELDVDCMSLVHALCFEGSCRCKAGHRLDGNTCRNFKELCASSPGYTWDAVRVMCYRIETRDTRNWTDAERICTVDQGHLIKPDTARKNDKLRALLKEIPTMFAKDGFWIGARFKTDAEAWRWHDNTAITSTQFGRKQPSGDGKCLDLWGKVDYRWNDNNCKALQYYICEIQLTY